ncbi:MAG TPA: hypothetical protein VK611_06915 [Acidimicrobiales bacterium]|nr:hypothetical protein [Acidimicrobiales bacterium]
MSDRLTARLMPTSSSPDELTRGWEAAFDLVVDLMAFAHIGLVGSRKVDVDLRADFRLLRQAAVTSAPEQLPALDGPRPLGTHVELDDAQVIAALRGLGPHVLNVCIYSEPDRALIQASGIAAASPLVDFDDFGDVLHLDVPRGVVTRSLGGEWTSPALQVWLDRAAVGTV